MSNLKRNHYCGTLAKADNEKEVVLCGWVAKRRDHGGLIFIDLRDRSGIVQVVVDPDHAGEDFAKAEAIRSEYVIKVHGVVRLRSEETINPNLATGEVEVVAKELEVLNSAKTPPFYIQDGIDVDENLRLKYRYLDLRRPEMQRNLMLRHKVTKLMRDYMDNHDFCEIETPMLTKSTPEGARDYLVPSRVNPGKFYALPQSPQIFKQLLMVAGMERYFQIVRCFRDEDLRADRQPEFTQLDIEMSFVDADDIMDMTEGLIRHVFKGALGVDLTEKFQRMTWDEAMDKYGSDKPDLRFGMELINMTEAVKGSEFKVFNDIIDKGGIVKAINVKGDAGIPRRELDGLVNFVAIYGAKGLAWMQIQPDDSSAKNTLQTFLKPLKQNRATCCSLLPTSLPLLRLLSAHCVLKWQNAAALSMKTNLPLPGLLISRCLNTAKKKNAMLQCTIRSPLRAKKIFLCLPPTPAKYMPKLMTWYLTAPKSAAVPSVSTDATCRTQYSMLSA